MRKKSGILLSGLMLFVLLFSITGCSSNSSEKAANTSKSSVSKESIFALYNKVDLNQNKTQIDAVLGSAGEATKSYDKCFNYMDKNHEYGVDVVYDDQQQAISKTVIYPTHADIAPFTSKAVTEEQADKLKKGMSYDEAKTILGGEGVEVSATEIAFENNQLSHIYRWANKDGSCIQIVKLVNGTIGDANYFEQ